MRKVRAQGYISEDGQSRNVGKKKKKRDEILVVEVKVGMGSSTVRG